MTTGAWNLGWATGDVSTAAEFKKGVGALYDSTLGASAASIDITGIVGSYAHLWLVVYARGDSSLANSLVFARFNGDSATNFDYQLLQGSGATTAAAEGFTQAQVGLGQITQSLAGSGLYGVVVGFIPHYAGSTNNKACVAVGSMKSGVSSGNQIVNMLGGFWRSSAAITRITLFPAAGNFIAGTRVTLYGAGA